MKHKLLFALAGALMSMSAMAQDVSKWADPVRPTFPETPAAPAQYTGSWATPEVGGKYYLYNVGAGLFLGGGQTWGTRGIVLADSVVLINQDPVAINNVQNNTTANYVLPFEIVAGSEEGYVQFNDLNNSKATSGAGHFVGEDGAQAWIDGDATRNTNYGDWTFQPYEGGYMIQNVYASTNKYQSEDGEVTRAYGVDGHNTAGTWATTWTDLWIELPEGNTTLPYIVWQFVDANDGEAVRAYAKAFKEAYNSEAYQATLAAYQAQIDEYNAKMKVYDAKITLRNTMAEADAAGIDVSEAETVYNNTSATLEEIEAQNSHLRALIAGQQYDFSGASESNPLDVTDQVLTNPDFEVSTSNGVLPPGWNITITGQNCGQQNRTDTNASTGLAITNFIEAWHPSSLGDGVIAQTVYGLPKGKYVLECDATACHDPANGDGSDIVGVNLFIQAGTNKATTRVGTARLGVTHYSVTYVNDGSDVLTFGLEAISTNANWLSADNFKLTYYGETTKTQEELALEAAIEEAEAIADNIVGNDIEDNSIFNVNAEAGNAFNATLEAAKAALGGSAEDMVAATAALGTAISDINNSNNLYKQFQEVYNQAMLTAQNLDGQWPELQDNIYDWAEGELTDGFNAGTLTEDDLAAAQGKVDELIAAFLNDPSKIQPGDDLTILIQNHDFNKGQYGNTGATTFDGDENSIPGWTVVSGNITELSGSFHNIETYHKAVNIQQTIKNLPAGSYQIGVQGFVRIDGGENDMVLYAGVSEKKFMEITAQSSEEQLHGDGTGNTGWPYDSQNPVLGGYMPNSMEGAGKYFETVNPATGEPFYLNTVNIAHAGGDLTIGVRCSATNLWILWDNFTLKYLGSDALFSLLEEIADKGDEMTALTENGQLTEKANELVADLQAKVEAADDITSSEEALALISELKDAIDYIKAGQALFTEITPLVDDYAAKYQELGLSDPAFEALLETLGAKTSEYETFADNDEIAQGIQDIKKGWTAAIVAGTEVGGELKGIILNPDFETGNINSWTDTFNQGNHGFQNNNTYSDADGNVVISNFAESWNNTNFLPDGSISQNIGILPEGWYQLEMDGYAVNQSQAGGAPADGVHGVDLFAKTGESTAKQSIGIGGENGVSQHWTLGFHSDGVSETVIGVMAEGANCNWTAFDNFKLIYYGDQVPDAVEAVATETTAAPKAIFTLDGRQTSTLRRGINIVRKADGTVQKVLVK